MNLGSFFLNLGVSGAESLTKALKNTGSGLEETRRMSLEAKAGILGVMYGFEELMRTSMNTGNSLQQLSDATGLNIELLQKYSWAATKAGVSNEEFTGTISRLQNQVSDIIQGSGALGGALKQLMPFGLELNQQMMRGDKGPEYILQQLSKVANAVPKDYFRSILSKAGFSDPIIAMLNKGTLLNPANFVGAPVLNNKQTQALQNAYGEWARLLRVIQHTFDSLAGRHGASLAAEMIPLARDVGKLVEALVQLTEKLHIFGIIKKSLEGWELILRGLIALVDQLSAKGPSSPEEDKVNATAKKYGIFSPETAAAMDEYRKTHPYKEPETYGDKFLKTLYFGALGGPTWSEIKANWIHMKDYEKTKSGGKVDINLKMDVNMKGDGKVDSGAMNEFKKTASEVLKTAVIDAITKTQGVSV